MSFTKQIFGDEARQKLLKGFEVVNSAVSVTAGPGGRTVTMQQAYGAPKITKDGISVAKAISLPEYEGEGVKMIVQASDKTATEAGDGTTATVILAHEIAKEGIKEISKGRNVTELKNGINYAVEQIVNCIDEVKKPVSTTEEIKQIATISANGDEEVGEFISSAIKKIGRDGVITVEEAKGIKSELEVVDGMKIERGYLSPYFITNPDKSLCEYDNPYVLLYDGKITSLKPILGILEAVAQSGGSLVIMADDVEGEALAALVVNRIRTGLKVCAIKAPSFGDTRIKEMEDLAILLNGKFICEKSGVKLENVGVQSLGTCSKVKISALATTFVNGSGSKESIEERCNMIRGEIENSESEYDKEQLKLRLARLAGGVAVLKVGGASEIEVKEKKDRVDDAVCATQAALEQGIVAGGCTTLINVANSLEVPAEKSNDYQTGFRIVVKACSAPLKKIAENAGYIGELVVSNVIGNSDLTTGFNAFKGEYVDMYEAGIIDPAKVVKCALTNSASVAGCLLTTEAVMIDDFHTNKEYTLSIPNQGMY